MSLGGVFFVDDDDVCVFVLAWWGSFLWSFHFFDSTRLGLDSIGELQVLCQY